MSEELDSCATAVLLKEKGYYQDVPLEEIQQRLELKEKQKYKGEDGTVYSSAKIAPQEANKKKSED